MDKTCHNATSNSPTKPLSSSAITAAPIGAILRDTEVPGLHLRVFQKRRSFYLYYRTKTGIERRPKIGDHGVVTLAEARRIARRMLVDVASGGDPVAERSKARSAPTVADVCDRYMREHAPRKKTGKEDQRMIDRLIVPKLGAKRVMDVDYDDVARIHDGLKSTPYQANRVLALLSVMFNLAERPWKYRPPRTNPCYGVARYPEPARRRYAKPAEIAKIGPLLAKKAEQNPAGVAFLYLLMFSGARPSEIERATWSQLERVERDDGTHGVLRIPDGKTGQRDVFLPPQAMAVIDRLPRIEGQTLAGKMPRKLWNRIRAEAGCPDLRMRDWRRTFAVTALSCRQSAGLIGELLGHRDANTTKIYLRLIDDAAHAAAAETAGHIHMMLQ